MPHRTPQKPVIVGVDGSESALTAVRWAAAEAASRDLPLRIVHGFIWPLMHIPDIGSVGEREGLREVAENLVEQAADRARSTAPDLEIGTELIIADGADALLRVSGRAALVVLGSRGLGGFTGLLVGSVAVAVAARGHSPVVVVRGRSDRWSVEDAANGGPVVVGVDGESSAAALDFAFEAASRRNTDLVAVHTWGDRFIDLLALAGADPANWLPMEARAARELADTLAPLRSRYPTVRVRQVVVWERPAHALITESKNAQLLVVGSRGRDGTAGLVLGSVSHAAIHHADCPVAVVRPDGS